MIEAGFEFDGEISHVLAALMLLPPPLRPIHFSHEEKVENDADRTEDQSRLAAFVAESRSGFFMLGPLVTYSIRISAESIKCDGFVDVEPNAAKELMMHMTRAHPLFGFACLPREREQRNRVTIQQGANKVEAWVGRNIQKYVPGFYWLTLLSEAVAKQHAIPLIAVEAVAREHMALEGQHLFQFYDRPEDWQQTSTITELCASLPGVFDIEKIKPLLPAAKNFLELNSILRVWK